MDIPHALWTKSYLTYTKRIVGFPAPKSQTDVLRKIASWLSGTKQAITAYLALISPSLFTQKATALQADDIYLIPFPETSSFDLSDNEQILIEDIVNYHRDLIRLGEDAAAMAESGHSGCAAFASVFAGQINAVYKKQPLRALETQIWPGVICQAFAFGDVKVDWTDADQLRGKIDGLLCEQQGSTLHVTRIARIYDGNCIFMLKPDRLRYWLRSVALRDADETLSDLRSQGF
jgi:hypothetical protein